MLGAVGWLTDDYQFLLVDWCLTMQTIFELSESEKGRRGYYFFFKV